MDEDFSFHFSFLFHFLLSSTTERKGEWITKYLNIFILLMEIRIYCKLRHILGLAPCTCLVIAHIEQTNRLIAHTLPAVETLCERTLCKNEVRQSTRMISSASL